MKKLKSKEKPNKQKVVKRKFNNIKNHNFAGNRYKIVWHKPDRNRNFTGLCDAPESHGRTMTIDPNIGELELLKTAIDESIHACIWPLDNDFVDKMSDSIGDLLWKMGFRLNEE